MKMNLKLEQAVTNKQKIKDTELEAGTSRLLSDLAHRKPIIHFVGVEVLYIYLQYLSH